MILIASRLHVQPFWLYAQEQTSQVTLVFSILAHLLTGSMANCRLFMRAALRKPFPLCYTEQEGMRSIPGGTNMNLASVIVLVVVFVLLALAVLFISQNGGWQGGCGGNCASCHNKCATPKPKEETKKP